MAHSLDTDKGFVPKNFVENLVDINESEEEIRSLELQKEEKSNEQVDNPEKIPTSVISQAFRACLSSTRPQQQQIADRFYADINKWCTDQLDVTGITMVVNFLFWYYRSANGPQGKFYSRQAEHIRYWADYPITNDIKWEYYNIKFDYIYSTALLQKSIPHMKKFYHDINKETPRIIPEHAKSPKPNYYLTKYQAACILGDWTGGVKQAGDIIRNISKATSATTTPNDYFMHYTLRALEMPSTVPNYGLIYQIVDKLTNEFAISLLPPPIFANWNILSFKYKNVDNNISYLTDKEFIYASDKTKDNDGYYIFYPQTSVLPYRINKKINIWGRVCQIVSPVSGAAEFLPLTGGWSETKLYLETNWTFRGSGDRLTRKHVIMRVERIPFEEEVESKDYFGQKQKDKGYIWKGYITIHKKKFKKGLTLKDLDDDHYSENNENKDNENNDDTIQQTQIYEVELIINTDNTNSNSSIQENHDMTVKQKPWIKHHRNSKEDETKKITVTFNKKPLDIHLAMETRDGFNACVVADRRNDKAKLKYGAQLYKINKTKTIGLSYESIIDILQKTKTPITLQFYERDELCVQWTKAFKLKEESNIQYKTDKRSEAIKTLSEAILLHPTNKIFYANRVIMAFKERKDLTLAMNDCRIIRELDPKSFYIKGHYLRGVVLMQMKQYEAAAVAFQTVIKLNSGLKTASERLYKCLTIVFGNTMIIDKYHIVDEKARNLVNGFIRNCQGMFDEGNSNSNIDFGIYKIVAIFLYVYNANITEKQREKWMEKFVNQKNEQT